ncbi:hypothetical protein RCM96_00050 [Escherichia coli]|nr:hypothetical protein [Escherichia coli]
MLCLKMLHNMNRAIAIRVAELKDAPTAQQPNKRATLRCFAELVLNTIAALLRSKEGSTMSPDEKVFYRRCQLVARDIHAQLESVGCDIDMDI